MRTRNTPVNTRPIQKPALILLAVALLVLLAIGLAVTGPTRIAQASTPPTVNGLFYGDGDNAKYWLYSTSEYGSKLYVYVDNATLYAALVVDRTVNDNVFTDRSNKVYTTSAGWGPHREAGRLMDSEFAEFTLKCDAAPLAFTWRQGYAQKVGGVWVSNQNVGAGSGTPPTGYVSSSSLAKNLNVYENTDTPPWNMYVIGTALNNWKSPFDNATPNVVPGLEGYPATGPIGYSSTYQWEWDMVYEWSVDLSATGCGKNPIYVLTGASHHSPIKNGDLDQNDDFCVDLPCDQDDALTDWGDLPDTYTTLNASSGAGHRIITNNPHLGPLTDPENDGVPSVSASQDDAINADDDDGVTRTPDESWTNGATVHIDFDVMCATTDADLAMWIDWDNSGTFEADEYYVFLNVPCNAVYTAAIVVPGASDYLVGRGLYVRARIFADVVDAPGGSLDSGDFSGLALSGEVEDYLWDFSPTAITLEQLSASNPAGLHPLVTASLLFLLGGVALTLLRKSRKMTG